MNRVYKVFWALMLVVLVFVAVEFWRQRPQPKEVSHLVNDPKIKVEEALGITLSNCPEMAQNVYHYSKTKDVRVDGNTEEGIGIVYVGWQCGFRIESDKYKLFDLEIGKSRVGMESKMTYDFEDSFEIDEGFESELFGKRSDFPVFYYNRARNDCLVVSCDKSTGIIVAVTYFSDFKRMTERLKMQ